MNFQFIKQWATIGCFSLAVMSGLIQNGQAQPSGRRAGFFCGNHEGKPATVVRIPQPNGGSISKTLIIWETHAFQDYSPKERCSKVSEKFQDNQNTGDLKYIVAGKANTWPVLCASKQNHNHVVDCPDPNILMTLLPKDNPQEMIRKLNAVNTNSSNTAPRHSSDEVLVRNGNLQAIHVDKWIENSPNTKIKETNTHTQEINHCIWGCE